MSTLPILQRRRERRLQHARSNGQRLTRAGLGCGLVFSMLLGLSIIGLAFGYASLTAGLPSIEMLPVLFAPEDGLLYAPTRLYDRSGQHVLAVLSPFDERRTYLSLDSASDRPLPEALARMTLAVADPNFYQHPGYRWENWTNPTHHPTLAQKLAADFLLWQEPPSLRRALRERILAGQITARFGRQQVLEWYLNTVDFGRHAYGVDAAARLYFGRPAETLTLAELAVLVSVSQSPAINPIDAPEAARQRAIETLATLPGDLFTPEEVMAARQQSLVFAPVLPEINRAPAFTTLALSQLGQVLDRRRIEHGGVQIVTSLDIQTQQQSQCALLTQLARLSGQPDPQGCQLNIELPPLPPGQMLPEAAASLSVLNPQNGQVLALVGEMRQGVESPLLMGHRPGTGLLPFIYLTGFSRGLTPASLVWDIPRAGAAIPNLNEIYHGPVRARVALQGDYLAPAQSVLEQMSLAAVLQTMRPFGLQLNDAGDFSALVNGQNLITPLAMSRAYGVFAANGTSVNEISTVLAVETLDGLVLWTWQPPQLSVVVSPQLSYVMNQVLLDASLERPAALKLGRTLDGLDTWALGYTPTRSVALWMGGGVDARVAAGMFAALLQAASQGESFAGWERPPGISLMQVCDPSGLLPTPACPNLVVELFLAGYEPIQADTLYKTVAINRETGLLATVFTPPHLVEERVFMLVPPEAQAWASAAGLPVPPTVYDNLQPPAPREGLTLTEPLMFAKVSGQVPVRGSAFGDGFGYYRLQYGQGLNPERWVLIGENRTDPVQDGLLGLWDTTGLDGLYALQLVLVYEDGRIETATVQVEVGE